jgi:hypothetical protein
LFVEAVHLDMNTASELGPQPHTRTEERVLELGSMVTTKAATIQGD